MPDQAKRKFCKILIFCCLFLLITIIGQFSKAEAQVDPSAIVTVPSVFNETISAAQTEIRELVISNPGGEPLDYTITTDLPPSAGDSMDNFGYGWKDSNDTVNPIIFVWNDIKSTGTILTVSYRDDSADTVSLPFEFPYFENTYQSVNICSNGYLTFGTSATTYSNTLLPNTGAPINILALFWDDLNPGSQGNIYLETTSDQAVIQFDNVTRYSTSSSLTFQVILKSSGEIYLYYKSTSGTGLNSATIGMQNNTKTDGFTIVYNQDFYKTDYAVYISPPQSWLSLSTESGHIAPGMSETISLTFNSQSMEVNIYDIDLSITHNGENQISPLLIPVTMNIGGFKSLNVSDNELDFGNVTVDTVTEKTIILTNTGTEKTTISQYTSNNTLYTIQESLPLEILPGTSDTLTIQFSPVNAGFEEGTINLVSDADDNPSIDISISGTGILAPAIEINQTSFTETMAINERITRNLIITNSGEGLLEWSIQTNHPDSISGGPDNFGYTWKDSNAVENPIPYQWKEIQDTGTRLSISNEDNASETLNLPFNFSFYGTTYNSVNICTNGFLTFGNSDINIYNERLPSSSAPPNIIAPYWDDLNPAYWGNIYVEAHPDQVIIQYDYIRLKNYDASPTFQVVLRPDGFIYFYYQNMEDDYLTSGTVGIQNQTQDDGLDIAYNTNFNHSNYAIRISPPQTWLSLDTTEGTIMPGMEEKVELTFDSQNLIAEFCELDLAITHNGTNTPSPLIIPVQIDVQGIRRLSLTPTVIDFGDIPLEGYKYKYVTLINNGLEATELSSYTTTNTDFSITTTLPTTIDPGATRIINVKYVPTKTGLYSDIITFISNAEDNPFPELTVTANGVLPPEISIDQSYFDITTPTNRIVTRDLVINNTGGYPFNYSLIKEVPEGKTDGMDEFGHICLDSDDPANPVPYKWEDIKSTGELLDISKYNDEYEEVSLPFSFPYYGSLRTGMKISTNGFISFYSITTYHRLNNPFPSNVSSPGMIAPFWDDLDPGSQGGIYFHANEERVIVQYDNVTRTESNCNLTFQVVLKPSGNIFFYYKEMNGDDLDSATIGMQNYAMDDGITIVYNTEFSHSDYAIRINPPGSWFSFTPESGSIDPGTSKFITLFFNAQEVTRDSFHMDLKVGHNADNEPSPIVIPVQMNTIGIRALQPQINPLNFGKIKIDTTFTRKAILINDGYYNTTITDIMSDNDDFSFIFTDPLPFILTAGSQKAIDITFSPKKAGISTGNLIVSNDAAENNPLEINLTGEALLNLEKRTLLYEDFENPLDATWTTLSTDTGRIRLTAIGEPFEGNGHCLMDSSIDNNSSLNEITVELDLLNHNNVILEFQHKYYSTIPMSIASSFTGHSFGNGVAISNDGTTWYRVQGLYNSDQYWTHYTVDLDAAIMSTGINYTEQFFIRFQQYDDDTYDLDGAAFDDILVYENDSDIDPFAVIRADRYYVSANETIRISGDLSFDPDGTIEAYYWDLDGDGEYYDSDTPVVDHVFTSQGIQTIGLKVMDNSGNYRETTLSIEVSAPAVYYESFENGAGSEWLLKSTYSYGMIEVATFRGANAGNHHLIMSSRDYGIYVRNWADLTVDLAGKRNLILEFYAKDFYDDPNVLATYFTNHSDGDGVAISADGVNWYRVADLTDPNVSLMRYGRYVIDLDAAVSNAGISYNGAFKIRFQQYGKYDFPDDGIGIDDIRIYPD